MVMSCDISVSLIEFRIVLYFNLLALNTCSKHDLVRMILSECYRAGENSGHATDYPIFVFHVGIDAALQPISRQIV